MPFTMTHLIIAKNIADTYAGHIGSLAQFYLGSIAPDAVHNRADYRSEYKKASHMINGDEQWGFTTKNDEWADNIVTFYEKHAPTTDRDFLWGYCVHAMADVFNNEHLWTPFRLKYAIDYRDYADGVELGYDSIYHSECNKIDLLLALTHEAREEFWHHLKNARGIDVADIIHATEIEKQRELILNVWYADKELPDIRANTIRTLADEMTLIKNATDYIMRAGLP